VPSREYVGYFRNEASAFFSYFREKEARFLVALRHGKRNAWDAAHSARRMMVAVEYQEWQIT